jgi:penicillin V acylase-like amidase (Ntn superfamily)
VITNPPDFPRHQENLKQFTSLPIDQVAPLKRSADEQGASGLDIGRKTNLPGEITSPNRFLRAALYSQYALPFADLISDLAQHWLTP